MIAPREAQGDRICGSERTEALRGAELALHKKAGFENLFYWAPFVVVGDGV